MGDVLTWWNELPWDVLSKLATIVALITGGWGAYRLAKYVGRWFLRLAAIWFLKSSLSFGWSTAKNALRSMERDLKLAHSFRERPDLAIGFFAWRFADAFLLFLPAWFFIQTSENSVLHAAGAVLAGATFGSLVSTYRFANMIRNLPGHVEKTAAKLEKGLSVVCKTWAAVGREAQAKKALEWMEDMLSENRQIAADLAKRDEILARRAENFARQSSAPGPDSQKGGLLSTQTITPPSEDR